MWAGLVTLLLSVFVFQPTSVLLVVFFTIRVNRRVMTRRRLRVSDPSQSHTAAGALLHSPDGQSPNVPEFSSGRNWFYFR